jgi:GntR family transcriptional regulator, transcriptional repressor for pyruvate dehydrogenase complex
MKKRERTTAVSKVAHKLREHALSTPPGELMGSEDNLVATYAVSRPTLRQAAALVAQEQVIMVRRGMGGGYFARRPDTNAVAHMAAIYLQSRRTTLGEIVNAIGPIKVEIATLAAQNRDPAILGAWRKFQAQDKEEEPAGGYREFLRSEREFGRILGAACRNGVLELFVLILYEFCASIQPDEDVYRDRPDRVHASWLRRQMCVSAIIEGDAEVAALSMARSARMVTDWTVEDMADQDRSVGTLSEVLAFPLDEGLLSLDSLD